MLAGKFANFDIEGKKMYLQKVWPGVIRSDEIISYQDVSL